MIREDSDLTRSVATERSSSHQIECRCSRVSVRRVNRIASESAGGPKPLTGEALESGEAAVSENIFLRTVSMLASPSAWV